MDTKIIKVKSDSYSLLKQYYEDGKVVAIPTETVYGLSADATNYEAVSNIFKAKGRPGDNPLIVHFYKLSQLDNLVYYKDEKVLKLMEHFWPGPMSIILKMRKDNGIATNVTAGLDTLALRMPSHKTARDILENTKILLAAPSANTSGKPSPTKFSHVFNDLAGKIDAIVEDEQSEIGLESTVIDCTKYPFVIARPGSISKEDIESVLGMGSVVYNEETATIKPISPGMKYRHYSPEAELIYYSGSFDELFNKLKDEDEKTGFITYEMYKDKVSTLPVNVKFLAFSEKDVAGANKNLYNILREYDLEQVKTIYILPIEKTKDNVALLNRLSKAISKK